jgi:hypothetical protein
MTLEDELILLPQLSASSKCTNNDNINNTNLNSIDDKMKTEYGGVKQKNLLILKISVAYEEKS